jgi:hypothetical protein
MKFEEPQIVLVGKAQNVVLGGSPGDNNDTEDHDSPNALELGLDE